jgi:GH24 family phage-related lysozyme (muramidase)
MRSILTILGILLLVLVILFAKMIRNMATLLVQKVSEERVAEVFRKDLDLVLEDCEILYKNIWVGFPSEVKAICANMMFNLGRTRLTKFNNMRLALAAGSWKLAAIEMQDSKWYYQVGDRSKRLVARMNSV